MWYHFILQGISMDCMAVLRTDANIANQGMKRQRDERNDESISKIVSVPSQSWKK